MPVPGAHSLTMRQRRYSLHAVAFAMTVSTLAFAQVPVGAPGANVTGIFGPVIQWPIIPIHVTLLPDGRVVSYGTDTSGNQGAGLIYDVWNPALGTGTNAHSVLPNTTSTDLFCSGQSLMTNGNVLITGGDLTIDGTRNYANNMTTIFSPSTNTISSGPQMTYPRWYPSLVSLPDGRLVVFGGYQNDTPAEPIENPVIPVDTPEIYSPGGASWNLLSGASSDAAFNGSGSVNWYYPKSYVVPGGNVAVIGGDGTLYSVSTQGVGNISQYNTTLPYGGDETLPNISYAPGKILSIRSTQCYTLDFTQPGEPVVNQTSSIDQYRSCASLALLADGTVFISGGSATFNDLSSADYQTYIWDPNTGNWSAAAVATQARLYHSNALLLPDATVLTTGGGAPGPVNNLNGEIYYPPYLYNSSGQLAVRPVITSALPQTLLPGYTIYLTVGPTDQISRLTFARTGSATHNNNSDQRFIDLSFQQSGQQLTATLPSDPTVLVPGYYMLFAFNQAGVPSTAQVVLVDPPSTVPVPPPGRPVPPPGRPSPPSLLWRNIRTEDVAVWLMNGINVSQSTVLGRTTPAWKILGLGDFTGQGQTDILWSNPARRELGIWYLNEGSLVGSQTFPFPLHGSTATVQAIGDFNGDGLADLVVRNSTNGNTWVLLNRGVPNFVASWFGRVPTNWVIAGLGDLTGIGTPELIWRNTRNGEVAAWSFSNGVPDQTQIGSVGLAWVIKACADVNGDGRDEIICQNSRNGVVAVWELNGSQLVRSATLGALGPQWAFSGAADLNGNGTAQLLWRNTLNGVVRAWTVNGSSFSSTPLATHPGLNWVLQPSQPVDE